MEDKFLFSATFLTPPSWLTSSLVFRPTVLAGSTRSPPTISLTSHFSYSFSLSLRFNGKIPSDTSSQTSKLSPHENTLIFTGKAKFIHKQMFLKAENYPWFSSSFFLFTGKFSPLRVSRRMPKVTLLDKKQQGQTNHLGKP